MRCIFDCPGTVDIFTVTPTEMACAAAMEREIGLYRTEVSDFCFTANLCVLSLKILIILIRFYQSICQCFK